MTRSSSDPVVIRTYQVEHEADLACAVLLANGIPAAVLRDNAGGMLPMLQAIFQIRLIVAADDAEIAHQILDDTGDEPLDV